MAPIGTAVPRVTTEHWDTNRLEAVTAGGGAAVPGPPTGGLTFDQPGGTPRRRKLAAPLFAGIAVAIVVAVAVDPGARTPLADRHGG